MLVKTPIGRPLADEHVIGVDPLMKPEQPDVWRRRINAFAGRALSDRAMTAEQDVRSGMQRLRGVALSPGVVEGLDVALDPNALGLRSDEAGFSLTPGFGVARSGEDVSLGAARRLSLAALPVILRADHADRMEAAEDAAPDAPSPEDGARDDEGAADGARLRPAYPRRAWRTLGELADRASGDIPRAGILLAQPVTATLSGRPADPCRPDSRDAAYADLQRIDGFRLALYLWPSEVVAADDGPDYRLPPYGPSFRNRLAWRIFDCEALHVPGQAHPWEEWGVPLGVIGFDDDWRLSFFDRHAAARIGGSPGARTPVGPGGGDSRLWRARVDQFVAHLADLPMLDSASLDAAFVQTPPAGVLPADMFDPVLRRQHFFPAGFGVSATPAPLDNLDMALRESAALAGLHRGVPDRVEILVPVPAESYDPGLLEIAREDPRIAPSIAAFRETLTQSLALREAGRRRYDRLMESVGDETPAWPQHDPALDELSPPPRVQTPADVARTRRFDELGAARVHVMSGAHAALRITSGDRIWFWVRIHEASRLTGISLRLSLRGAGGAFSAGVYWGEAQALPIAADATGLEARRVGDLPEKGVWVRLEAPAAMAWSADGGGLDGVLADGVEFGQRGGAVEWAAMGRTGADGGVVILVSDHAPAGATLTVSGQEAPGWPWTAAPGRAEMSAPDFGTVEEDGVRRVSAVDAFRARWTQSFLRDEMPGVGSDGVDAYLHSVDTRLKATNDAIDLGFVRARADIYRVRQIMLGADAASRMVTSPSLADLAMRDEGARATSKGISEYLAGAVERDAMTRPLGGAVVLEADKKKDGPADLGGVGYLKTVFTPMVMTLNGDSAKKAAAPAASAAPVVTTFATVAAAAQPAKNMLLGGGMLDMGFGTLAPPLAAPPLLFLPPAPPAAPSKPPAQPGGSLTTILLDHDLLRYQPRDIQSQLPVAGLVERTVSVAERLTPPPSVQALNYAIASKAAVIATLSGLVTGTGRARGVVLGDLPVPGFCHKTKKEGDSGYIPLLSELIADRAKASDQQVYMDADQTLPADKKHEADYFTAAVQAIDNSVAIMRLVEGRVALFEALAQDLRDLRAAIGASASSAAAWLRAADVEVEEARHDLAVGERLRAEEAARVEALNARRAAILSQVRVIAFRRVRAVDHRRVAPSIAAGSALAEDPVLVCRREHEDAPDEIRDYVALMREAPVKWFPRIAVAVSRIDRLDGARAAIEGVTLRAAVTLAVASARPALVSGAAPKLLRSVQSALTVRAETIQVRKAAAAQIDLAMLPALTLAQSQAQILETASIADLIEGRHRQPALSRMAAEEMDGLETVAACLHSGFAEVPTAIRLRWAELLSGFDRPAPLQSLSGLPGWAELELDRRRTLQGFVDWLFSRIDPDIVEARDAMNELVRVALLMSAQAPVDRVIPARLVAPAPARPGTRLQLALDVSRVRQGMTTLIRDADDRVVVRAVVEDIVDGFASAVVVAQMAPVQMLTASMRVHLIGGSG